MYIFVAGSLSNVRHKTLLFLMYELIVFEVTFIVMNPFAGFFDTSIAFLCGPLFALFAPQNQAGYRLCSFAFPVCIACFAWTGLPPCCTQTKNKLHRLVILWQILPFSCGPFFVLSHFRQFLGISYSHSFPTFGPSVVA